MSPRQAIDHAAVLAAVAFVRDLPWGVRSGRVYAGGGHDDDVARALIADHVAVIGSLGIGVPIVVTGRTLSLGWRREVPS
jgi:hypothetical protein